MSTQVPSSRRARAFRRRSTFPSPRVQRSGVQLASQQEGLRTVCCQDWVAILAIVSGALVMIVTMKMTTTAIKAEGMMTEAVGEGTMVVIEGEGTMAVAVGTRMMTTTQGARKMEGGLRY
ncbi:hypothetical protein VUR80DRAFT_7017 [Thermomyces stellatus]